MADADSQGVQRATNEPAPPTTPAGCALEDFRVLVRTALSESVDHGNREPVFWSNRSADRQNELEARAFRAEHADTTILASETTAGRALAALVDRLRPSQGQLDVAWGLLSHRFALQPSTLSHAFVSGSMAARTFRAVEARELAERGDGGRLHLHEGNSLRTLNQADVEALLVTN
jgi:hypothetical protein